MTREGCHILNLQPQAISEEPQAISEDLILASLMIARKLPAANRDSILPFPEIPKNLPLDSDCGLSFASTEATVNSYKPTPAADSRKL